MRIIYIANARIPTEKAHGLQIVKMCEAFALQGAEVTLVVPHRKGTVLSDPFSYYSIEKKFSIKYLPILETYTWGYLGFILGSCSFAISSYVYCLYRQIKDSKLIFYSRDQDQFSFFPFFFGLRPYFFEIHGCKKKSFFHKKLFKNIKGVIATNSFIKEKLSENFPRISDRIILLPNGVDTREFIPSDKDEARRTLSLPLLNTIILYAGHFYAWKGVDTLVDAAPLLSADKSVYLVGGHDEDIQRLKKTNPQAAERVTFIGFRPHSEIPVWYSAADVLVITGTAKDADSVHYTSPIKLFEYMAMGRPIVAVDSPALRDIVSEHEVYFYKPDDATSLAQAVNQVLADKSVATQKALSARNKVEQYSWNNRARQIIKFMHNAI